MNSRVPILLLSIVAFVVGCGQTEQPETEKEPEPLSYSDALTLYNQELSLLDHLKKEQSELQQKLAPQGIDIAEGLLGAVGGLQGELTDVLKDLDPTLVPDTKDEGDPVADISAQIGQLRKQSEQDLKPVTDRLEELAKEIVAQSERVQRAKDDMETARTRERGE